MKVIVDAHGGDNAPLEIILGCKKAKVELDVKIVLCGKTQELKELMVKNNIDTGLFDYINTTEIIDIEDDPSLAIRNKKDSSMVVGLRMLRDGEGDAFVSAGSTGALLAGATLIVKRIDGIKRAALAPILPTNTGHAMLIDAGANVEVKPEYLLQFGIMGSSYMKYMMNVTSPKVALINVGSEPTKGTQLQLDAYEMLKCANLNFVGNIEGRDILSGDADVIVADGFTGNVLLKVIEGMGIMFYSEIKGVFKKNILTKLAALLTIDGLKAFAKKMDYKEQGGAPLMGISKPVIKAHGSSDARAFCSAIRQAVIFAKSGVIDEIYENVSPKTAAQIDDENK